MGILNVTPDSFSDAGQFLDPGRATEHGLQMLAQGADLIDIGGESTRPGSQRVEVAQQLQRILPVLQALRRQTQAVISVDTTRCAVARAALDHGATLVNDISAGRDDPDMLPLVAGASVPIILMHMQGQPATMQQAPTYNNVVAEVGLFLRQRLDAALAAGISPHNLLLDPGIGFGKTVEHNLQLLQGLPSLCSIGRPLVIGTSRKRFLSAVLGDGTPSARLMGTAATVAWSLANGAAIVRVHDVEPAAQVARMILALRGQNTGRQILK
jgi:dihydropteroate synthase